MPYVIKILLVLLITIAAMRLMGKSTIVQLTPYDLVSIIIVGTIVAEPLVTTDFIKAVYGTAVVVGLHILFSKLTLNQAANKFFLGEPTILIKHGKIDAKKLKKSHISLMQLLASIRSAGYPDLADVDYAILEPIGAISVIPKQEASPVTIKDLQIPVTYEGLPIALVIDTKIQRNNLQLVHKDEQWLKTILSDHGITDLQKVMYASIRKDGRELFIAGRDGWNKLIPLSKDEEKEAEKKKEQQLQISLITKGRFQSEGLSLSGLSQEKILAFLKEQGVERTSQVEELKLQLSWQFQQDK